MHCLVSRAGRPCEAHIQRYAFLIGECRYFRIMIKAVAPSMLIWRGIMTDQGL
ncbi:hypothetical protein D3C87_1960010 [compost metagenome]